jgi:5-deoxy-glucuronate isomerase
VVASGAGAELALPYAEASRRLPAAYVAAKDIVVETRGAGSATRQINNLFVAGGTPAHRLVVVEVLTPGGNWSSYPPHKHDDATTTGEAALEEIYYFRIQGEEGFGLHRTYTADGSIDETVVVRDGDVFLVPRGYHGPCVAPPEFPMYYLNVLAGASDARSLGYSDDPTYGWIRDTWKGLPRDPRVPLVTATGAVG